MQKNFKSKNSTESVYLAAYPDPPAPGPLPGLPSLPLGRA